MVFSHAYKDFLEDDPTKTWFPGKQSPPVPTMFVTSAEDTKVVYHGLVYQAYEENLGYAGGESSSYETVFVSTIGGHQAPLKSAAGFNVWTGRFLFCHLASPTGTDPRKKETCDRIYDGSTNHICKDDLLQNLCWDTADWVGNPTYECKAGSGSGLVGPKCRLPRNRA